MADQQLLCGVEGRRGRIMRRREGGGGRCIAVYEGSERRLGGAGLRTETERESMEAVGVAPDRRPSGD